MSAVNEEEPLYASNVENDGTREGGCENCEYPDKCCGCLPIKGGLVLVTGAVWMSFLVFVKYIQDYVLIQDIVTKNSAM